MATPHVVGLGAYLLGLSGPLTPAALKTKIQSMTTNGVVSIPYSISKGGTPNKLAYNGIS